MTSGVQYIDLPVITNLLVFPKSIQQAVNAELIIPPLFALLT